MVNDFLFCLLISSVSIAISGKYFPEYIIFASSSLIAIGIGSMIVNYLEKNREAIWKNKISSYQANRTLAEQMLLLFIAVFSVGIIYFAFIAPQIETLVFDSTPKELRTIDLLLHNAEVLIVSITFGLLYGGSGLMLILAWNALSWSQSFVEYLGRVSLEAGIPSVLLVCILLLPHLFLEVSAYVMGGMSGIFFTKAVKKYNVKSKEFSQVSSACLGILVCAGVVLFLAACFESMVFFEVFKLVLTAK